MSESKKAPSADDVSRISKLFDIRLIVGGLLTVYGAVLLVTGLVESRPHKSGGMHLNLWTGIGMLVVGLFMLAWMRLRPLAPPEPGELAPSGPQDSRAG
jgi:xanthine/uracil/vitamin C permease (AzgA family)